MSNYIDEGFQKAKDSIEDVIISYGIFMETIGNSIERSNENVAINRRKLLETKYELHNYLAKHKHVFELTKLTYKRETKEWKQVVALESFENFIKVGDFLKYISEKIEIEQTNPETDVGIRIHYATLFDVKELKRLINTISGFSNCRDINIEYIKAFLDNNFLVNNFELNTKCSSYEELQAYIEKRTNDYLRSEVSSERINEFSFTYRHPIADFKDEKSCGKCWIFYQEGQEVCCLPCKHFYCRDCTEKMFAAPEIPSSERMFQCPTCDEDCT